MRRSADRPGIVFEIRKHLDGRWELDSIFNDKEVAVEEANELMERRASLCGVRVIAVAEDGDKFREWTVFKRDKGQNRRSVRRPSDVRSCAPAGPASGSRELYGRPKACADQSFPSSGLIFCAQMTFGVAMVLGTAAVGFYLITTIF